MKQLITIGLFLIWNMSIAQDFKLAGIEYKHHPASSLEYDNIEQITLNNIGVYVNIPIVFKDEKTTLIIGPRYNRLTYQLTDSITDFSSNLHSLSLSFTGLYKWKKKWTLVGYARPGIGSDFSEETSNNPILFEGAIVVVKEQKKGLSIGAGFVMTNYVGILRKLPLGILNYENKKHKIDVLMPSYAKYYYQLNEKNHLHLGFLFSLGNGTYNTTLLTPNLFEIPQVNSIVLAQANIGPSIKARFVKNIEFEVFSGWTVLRNFNLRDEEQTPLKTNPSNNGFIQIGMHYVFVQ